MRALEHGSSTKVIMAGWLLDGRGTKARQDVLMVVEEGVIRSLLGGAEAGAKGGLETDDFSRYTVLPGLIDGHVHISMSGTTHPQERKNQLMADYDSAKERVRENLSVHLAHGVLAVRDGGDRHGHALRYKRERDRGVEILVHLCTAGRAWHAPGRYGGAFGNPPLKDLSLAGSILRMELGVDVIKIMNSGPNSLSSFGRETPPQFSLDELQCAVRSGRSMGLKVMVHANGREPVRLAVEAGCDSVEHGYFMGKDNLKRMAERGTTWVPTVFAMEALCHAMPPGTPEREIARRTLDSQLEQIRMARDFGVAVAVGTDAGSLGVDHGSSVLSEMGWLISSGMPLEEAVQCATSRGAALLGIEGRTGVLGPGEQGTFIVARGAPEDLLESLRSPEAVFIRGKPLQGFRTAHLP